MKHVIMCFVASLLLSLVSIPMLAQQQSRLISGIIKDESGEPMIGASVLDVSTKQGTIADMDGKFTLEVTSSSKLQISFVGYKDQIISGKDLKKDMIIVLKSNTEMIDELVVVGYGSQKKATLTGAVSSISTEEMVTTKNEDLSNMLTGKIAGVRVVQNSSEPGAFNTSIDIRGLGNPLVVIDGIPRDNMARIDPEDVESISVLKDASASIYGVRAANGVILITTKKGTSQKPEISYTGSFTWQKPSNFPDMVDAQEWMTLANEISMHKVDGGGLTYTDSDFEPYRTGTKKSTDWKGAVMKNTAPQTQHAINISGGTDRTQYFTSFGYQYQESFLKTDDMNYKKFNIRSNINTKITDHLSVDLKLFGMMDERNTPTYGSWDIVRAMWLMPPLDPIYQDEAEGKFYQPSNTTLMNPVAIMNSDNVGYCTYQSKWFQSSMGATYELPWIEGLSISGLFSYDYILNDNKQYRQTWYSYRDEQKYTWLDPSYVQRNFYGKDNVLWQAKINYAHDFDGHNIGATLVYEESHKEGDNFWGRRDLSLPIDQVFAGMSENQQFNQSTSSSALYERANQALIGRFTYDYLSKYLVQASFRYDGSSKFYNKKWGFFPSLSLGWRISEESFFKDNISFVDNLKLRASIGRMGDDNVEPYLWMMAFNYPGDDSYVLGDGSLIPGVGVPQIPNVNATWYTSTTKNLGIDLSLWNAALTVEFDLFRRDRDGLLANRIVSVPGTFGATFAKENINSDMQEGFELVLGHNGKVRDFSYQLRGNFTYTLNRNKYVESVPSGNSYDNWRNNTNDRNSNILWMYQANGQFVSMDDIYNNPVLGGVYNKYSYLPGDIKYVDFNEDGMIDEWDMQPLMRNNTPIMNFGLTLSGQWKGLDLSMSFQGASMFNARMNASPLQWGGSAWDIFMDRWHKVDASGNVNSFDPDGEWVPGKYPSTRVQDPQNYGIESSFWYNNCTYLRLKNLEIGYTFPSKWTKFVGINSLRLYANGYNLFTIQSSASDYIDPENPGGGIDRYPIMRNFNFGINVNF